MALREWAQKALSRESAEEGAKTGVVRLSSSDTNTTWETWTAPFPDVETFLQEAEAVKGQIAEECPVRRVPLMFTAESSSGATIAQYPTSIQGKNRQADALAGSGNNAAKAFAEAMEGISRVVVATLKSAEVQIGSLTKTLESQATQIHDLIEYQRVKQELELTEKQDNNTAQNVVMDQVKQILPMIPEALGFWLESQKNSPAKAAVAEAVKTVATNLTNGVSP